MSQYNELTGFPERAELRPTRTPPPGTISICGKEQLLSLPVLFCYFWLRGFSSSVPQLREDYTFIKQPLQGASGFRTQSELSASTSHPVLLQEFNRIALGSSPATITFAAPNRISLNKNREFQSCFTQLPCKLRSFFSENLLTPKPDTHVLARS